MPRAGQMAFGEPRLQHGTVAKTCAHAVCEKCDVFRPPFRLCRRNLPAAYPTDAVAKAERRTRSKPQPGSSAAAQPAVHERACRSGPARAAAARRRRNARNGAVDPKEEQFEEPRPFASPFEVTLEAFGEERDQTFDVLDKADGLGEVAFHRKRRHGQARRDDLLDPSQRLVEPQQQHRAEAAGEHQARVVRQRQVRPSAALRFRGWRWWPPRASRRRAEGFKDCSSPSCRSACPVEKRAAPGCARRRGKSGPGVKTLLEKAGNMPSSIASSSPKRWAQPVISRNRPSAPSRATSGV